MFRESKEIRKSKESYPQYTQNAPSLKPVWWGKPVKTKEKMGCVRKVRES